MQGRTKYPDDWEALRVVYTGSRVHGCPTRSRAPTLSFTQLPGTVGGKGGVEEGKHKLVKLLEILVGLNLPVVKLMLRRRREDATSVTDPGKTSSQM